VIEQFRSRCAVPVSLVVKDVEYLWDAIDRVIADARRALLGNELVGGLTIHVHRRPNLARPSYGVELTCTVDRGGPR
jgi:hypothetical protein